MIGFPTGAHIWIVAGVTDLRRGFTGLSALVETALQRGIRSPGPFSSSAGGAAI